MPRLLLLSNARSGSSFFQDLLSCHPEITLTGEILNDEFGLVENPLETISSTLSQLHNTYIGFKLFPEQVYIHNLHFGKLIDSLGITHVIVLWRENILEGYASQQIAFSTNVWYSTEKPKSVNKILLDISDYKNFATEITENWNKIGQEWPVDVRPIYVKFENLIKNPTQETKRVLAEMSLVSNNYTFLTPSERQNPAPSSEKVLNFDKIPENLRHVKLDAQQILQTKIERSLQVPAELLQFVPDREPCMPAGGWLYTVAEPYMPAVALQNAFDALQSGSISSAGYWPKEMSKRLRALFNCPVAQPCSNGFTALLLAMQVANIGEGDEVIVPSMTMVAVPNAVHYLRATPIFADNAEKTGYNPNWKDYEIRASEKTKAIVVTHTYGVPVEDIETIAKECKKRGWTLIEDISECVGVACTNSKGEPQLLGTFGDFSIASLYVNKIVHGGDGGFVVAKDAKVGKRLLSITNHGFTPSFHFVHFEPSPNAKINGIGAAIATGCLDELSGILGHRAKAAKWYRDGLEGLPIDKMPKCGPTDTPWVFGIECQSKHERTKLRAFMASYGIETRDYFFPLHLQPAYFKNGDANLPNAENLSSRAFYLPTHSNLTEPDVKYICQVVRAYFENPEEPSVEKPQRPKFKDAVQISANNFAVQVRRYAGNGELRNNFRRNHSYIRAVQLGLTAEGLLLTERYDQVQLLIKAMKKELNAVKGDLMEQTMQKYFSDFIQYFDAYLLEQPCNRPWLQIELEHERFQSSKEIPTTTDPETFKLLLWLMEQRKPEVIWEIGCWMGHATKLMAQSCSLNTKIFAMDAFKLQNWMHTYLPDIDAYRQNEGTSFLKIFKENLAGHENHVEAVEWPYDISKLPVALQNQNPDLIYLDITQEDEDLELIWNLMKDKLVPNKTIILFNGLAVSSIPFFVRHSNELKAFAKPHTIAKAFVYVSSSDIPHEIAKPVEIQRRLKFYNDSEWDHHHDNLFRKAVNLLHQNLHDDNAPVLFVPAVEQTLCDDPETLYETPWIGIIHSVQQSHEYFYVPDLERLCTKQKFLLALRKCKGLFTLTDVQANYLKSHLPENLPKFPIQILHYPIDTKGYNGVSQVPELIIEKQFPIEVLHIGSFARDFDLFFQSKLPQNFQKVLVVADEICEKAAINAPNDVKIVPRLSSEDYEKKILSSVIFLSLKYDGAANTLILECIARNLPVLSPNYQACQQYLGKDYPLFYDPRENLEEQFTNLLKVENIQKAIKYLQKMNKSKVSYENFLDTVLNGAVLNSVAPLRSTVNAPESFDVTICICSYKRTHHLPQILERLWNHQDFKGSFEIFIWNNNECRKELVDGIAQHYIENSTTSKSLQLVNSSENHYCAIRFAMPALMKGKCLLICDDDVIPGNNFISFFHSAHQKHPQDVLCVRGHIFLPHEMDVNDPGKCWNEYEGLRFRNDDQPEQFIHFVHADACLIPKQALHEVASVEMPDSDFTLVDDYWMSYVLSHKFNRKLRKLCTLGQNGTGPIERTDDSDKEGLALHTRPETKDARLRMYIHHMLQGWPKWKDNAGTCGLSEDDNRKLKAGKIQFWNEFTGIGWNISSLVDNFDIEDLRKMGTKLVRIGAVGVGGKLHFEFSNFLRDPDTQMKELCILVGKLQKAGIMVVVTLERRVASVETWKFIAENLATFENVVGYDLINEPFTDLEKSMHWADLEEETKADPGVANLIAKYEEMIAAIRSVDVATPIILETSFWGKPVALKKFALNGLRIFDDNILVSVHFYEPSKLTARVQNKGRYGFPGEIPKYEAGKFAEVDVWNEDTIYKAMKNINAWADDKGVKIFLGEFGICRDIKGAPDYLREVAKACKIHKIPACVFSFRDQDWEAMDYEFGVELGNCKRNRDAVVNPFVSVIRKILE